MMGHKHSTDKGKEAHATSCETGYATDVPQPSGYPPSAYPARQYPVCQYPQATQYPPQYGGYAQTPYTGQMPPQYTPQYEAPPPYSAAMGVYPGPAPTGCAQPAPKATYVIPDAFDAGARFNNVSTPNIPPPPPGHMPNAAQMAAAQGHNVVLGQKQESFLSGGHGGGYTFW